jgi:hypothetical protein
MLTKSGASEETRYHPTKASVRREIRAWDAKGMIASVYRCDGKCIYNGSALSF